MNRLDRSVERQEMVERQIRARGVVDASVIQAMAEIPREAFVIEELRDSAYDDTPLPIAASQTISQPYMVAFMVDALSLRGGERVLEIGTGSGYAAAILSRIAGEVFTVERIKELADQATVVLKTLDLQNIRVRHGDGSLGWRDHAPYDAIAVSAGAPVVPESLQSQLKIGGRMVIPVGSNHTNQRLLRITRISESNFESEDIAGVRFVPLIGKQGWHVEPKDGPATSRPRR